MLDLNMRRAKILIAGFGSLGREFIKILPPRSFDIYALGRSVKPKGDAYQGIKADLCNRGSLNSLNKNLFDIIIFCPAPDKRTKRDYLKTYLGGIKNILSIGSICTHLKKFIFISSTSVYGHTNAEWVDENSHPKPMSFNGKVILRAEKLLLDRLYDKTIILRFGGIYGKENSRLLEQIEKKTMIPHQGGGDRYTNRIHIRDCALMVFHMINLKKFEPVYIGVDHRPASSQEVIEWIAKKKNMELPFVDAPYIEAGSTSPAPANYGNSSNKRCKNQKILNTGFHFLYPTYREGYTEILGR